LAFDSEERTAPGRRLETIALCVLFLGIVALATLQIVLRNFFSYSLYWADEVIRLAVLWLAMVGGMAASRDGRHIAIGIVENYCPRHWRKPAAVAAAAFASLVSAALAWQTPSPSATPCSTAGPPGFSRPSSPSASP
jgi:TRAP-type C4-dicarboxylate transport system permease small subunit